MTDVASLNCPNCGAPLDFPEGQTSVRCRFCDSTIERSVSAVTDDDDANIIQIDVSGFQTPGVAAGPARRFVIKMRNGQPVIIETGKQPAAAPTTAQMFNAGSANAAAAAAAARSRAYAPSSPSKSSSRGCIVAIVGVLAVVCLIAAITFGANPQAGLIVQQLLAGQFDQALAISGTLGANILLTESGVLIPGPNDGPDQAVMLSIQYPANGGEREYRVMAVDTETHKLLWQSVPLDPKLYDTRFLYNNDLVFLISGTNLVALRRADGSTAWTAPLADKIELNICLNCLQLVGDRLAALSDDGTLAMFDAATGQSQWHVRAIQDSPRGLYVLGQRVAFMDRRTDARGILRAFDLATGKEQSVQPDCGVTDTSGEFPDWTTRLLPSADGAGVFLAFGYSPTCIQRWDTRSLKLDWSSQLPENFSSSIDSVIPVLNAGTIFLASSRQVLAVSTKNGEVTSLVQDDDHEFAVAAVHDQHLILRARNTRGSTRYELWNVDTATGKTRWKFDLGDNPPVEPASIIDDNTPEWVVQPAEAGLRVLRFKSAADNKSHAILSETLDWATGQTSGQKSTVLNLPTIIFDAPSWITWKQDTLWMVIENELLAFDANNNKVIARWP
jgi:LSD1 subclass zinc finger protein